MTRIQSSLLPLLCTAALTSLAASQVSAAPVFFEDEVAFQTASGALTTDDFESYTGSFDLDGTPASWGTMSCLEGTPTSFCTAYSGIGDLDQYGVSMRSGINGMTFATPDTLQLDFTNTLTSFGIWIAGFGNKGPLDDIELNAGDLSAAVSGTTATILSGHADFGPAFGNGNSVFFGVVDAAGFDTISFSGTNRADSVFFDDLSYATAAAAPVPLPASAALLALGLGGLVAMRRKSA